MAARRAPSLEDSSASGNQITSSGDPTWQPSSSWWRNFLAAAVHVKVPSSADVAGLAGRINAPPASPAPPSNSSTRGSVSSGSSGGAGSRVIYPVEAVSLGNAESDLLLGDIRPIREGDEAQRAEAAGGVGGGHGMMEAGGGKGGRERNADRNAAGAGRMAGGGVGGGRGKRAVEEADRGGGGGGGGMVQQSIIHLQPHTPPALTRSLSLFDLVLLGIGASIGSGIFVVTGVAARLAGPAVSLSFLLAGLASLLNALCYADLAARFPGRVGGAYLYAHACLGQLAAFVLFCHLVLDYHVGAAAIARSLASYLASLVQVATGVGLPGVMAPGGLPLSIPLPFLSPSWLLWWFCHWWFQGQRQNVGDMGPGNLGVPEYLSVSSHSPPPPPLSVMLSLPPPPPVPTLDLSINLVAPAVLLLITWLLCRGVRDTSKVNDVMTSVKLAIVVLVVAVGACHVDPANWFPFFPSPSSLNSALSSTAAAATAAAAAPAAAVVNSAPAAAAASTAASVSSGGVQAMLAAASLVFFSYIGFDAVANTSEEAIHPRRDVPRGLLLALGVCSLLYVSVSLVLTGMVSYTLIDSSAPLSSAFASLGLHFMERVIDLGAVVGLTTTLLTGLYVQSRMYLALARDGLLPHWFSRVNERSHVPVHAQWWVGGVAAAMAAVFDVGRLSHILSVGVLLGYSIVCLCVLALRVEPWGGMEGGAAVVEDGGGEETDDALLGGGLVSSSCSNSSSGGRSSSSGSRGVDSSSSRRSSSSSTDGNNVEIVVPRMCISPPPRWIAQWGGDKWHEALTYVCALVACVLALGFATRFAAPWMLLTPLFLLTLTSSAPIFLTQHYRFPASGFACPWVPFVPVLGVCVNMYLLAQTHIVAWVRLLVLTVVALVGFWWKVRRSWVAGV